jgi:hypothetical protein
MAGKTSTAMRALAHELTVLAGVPAHTRYDPSGRRWQLEWSNGPTIDTMTAHLADLRPRVGLAHAGLARIGYQRIEQDDAHAVQAIRLGLAAALPLSSRHGAAAAIRAAAAGTDHPSKPNDPGERQLAERLQAAAGARGADGMAELICAHHGISWLVETPGAPDAANTGATAPGDLRAALHLLTARYATGPAATAWRRQAAPLALHEALTAARDDDRLPAHIACAALTVLRRIRCDLDAAELSLITAARGQQATWATIGAAIGATKQGAAKRHADLTKRARLPTVDPTAPAKAQGQPPPA